MLMEGDDDRTFGVIVKGFVEVSIEGRVVCRLGPGEVVGEMAYLHPKSARRRASVVTLEPTTFLEINPSALALELGRGAGALPEGPHRPCARPAGAGRCRYRPARRPRRFRRWRCSRQRAEGRQQHARIALAARWALRRSGPPAAPCLRYRFPEGRVPCCGCRPACHSRHLSVRRGCHPRQRDGPDIRVLQRAQGTGPSAAGVHTRSDDHAASFSSIQPLASPSSCASSVKPSPLFTPEQLAAIVGPAIAVAVEDKGNRCRPPGG